MTFEDRVVAFVERLRRDERRRTRLWRWLWVLATLFTIFGYVVILFLLHRQGVLAR